jgi:formylglycine-generating enzyme required for sulfatase activity
MTWVPGGTFEMGSEEFYPEERPIREATVEGFWIDVAPVTVAEFRRFVKATGHVPVAERTPDPADYPDADHGLLVPGSLVFRPTRGPVDLSDSRTGAPLGATARIPCLGTTAAPSSRSKRP